MADRTNSRRSTTEVRALIRDAARQEFAERGYADTTMRSIASTARVSTSVVYRHFSSKEELSRETLMAPFLAFLTDFARAARDQRSGQVWNDDLLTQEFVRDLHTAITKHKTAMFQLVSLGESSDSDMIAEVKSAIGAMLAELRQVAEPEAQLRGWADPTLVEITNRLVIAMITGVVLLGPWLTDDTFTEQVLLQKSADLTLYGVRLGASSDTDPDG